MSNVHHNRTHEPAGGFAEIAELRGRIGGNVLLPDEPGYDDARAVWNGEIDRRPAAIVQCNDSNDVVHAVGIARDLGVPAAVRGGAHNVGGTAVCDGGVVIDLQRLKGIEIDPAARVARVEGGATWGELDAATQAHGLATPGGVVSKTGVAGLTLNGGIGWLRRRYGLSCDNLVAAEIVTADGWHRRVDAENEPELFWGIRGGGGNFGVVTAFHFRLHPVGPDVMFAATFYPAEMTRDALRFYREFTRDLDPSISSFVICGTIPDEPDFPAEARHRPYVLLAGCHCGDPETGRSALAPLRELGQPLTDFSDVMPYTDVQQILDGDYPDGRRYYWKSRYLRTLSDAAIDEIERLAAERPSALSTVDVWHLGGEIARQSPSATAFENRDAPFLLGIESNWDDAADSRANIDWTRSACERMAPWTTGAGYLNFEPADDAGPRDAYAGNHARLQRLKAAVDPANLFCINHNIVPDAGALDGRGHAPGDRE